MKAAVVKTKGGPLVIEDRPVPRPGSEEVVIRVHACGVCHSDSFTVEGQWPGLQL
ncbi:MAG: alcohol dehydrogenase catalytic domain-containing protein, partial [Acidobacteriota bacterium]|nr:alcohol dehydrogenase catalytic domain-containing protein [Acidobacteriota bacterium]